jgi:type IV secretory pathway TrbD component
VVPADIDTVDQIAWGLSFRQLAILAGTAAALWAGYSRFGRWLPVAAWVPIGILALGVAATVALGRRDGQPLDVWLRHGLALHTNRSRITTPGDHSPGSPLAQVAGRPVTPAPLRSQVTRIAGDGTVTVDGVTRHLIACGTTSVALRTGEEQSALLAGFGRWLNALPGPAQMVVSAARHDLTPHAQAVLEAAPRLPHPALQDAAADHATFLLDLDTDREPLRRQVLTVLPTSSQPQAAARALTGLGVTVHHLDGPEITAALATAVDPYTPPVPGPRAAPGTVITTWPRRTSTPTVDSAPTAGPPSGDDPWARVNPWIQATPAIDERSTP